MVETYGQHNQAFGREQNKSLGAHGREALSMHVNMYNRTTVRANRPIADLNVELEVRSFFSSQAD